MKYKNIILKHPILFIVVIVISFLLLFEVILRIIPVRYSGIDTSIPDSSVLYSPTRIQQYKPNYARSWTGLGPRTIWHINSLGFRGRDPETNVVDGSTRILVLGDSVVMGMGVEEDETFPYQLEKELMLRANKENFSGFYEVFNLGMPGYSGISEEATLRELGAKLKPNIVLVENFGDDASESYSDKLEKTYLTLRGLPDYLIPLPINQFFERHSYLYLFLLNNYYTFIGRFQLDAHYTPKAIEEGWKLNEQSYQQMQNISNQLGAKFVLIGVPEQDNSISKTLAMNKDRVKHLNGIISRNHFAYLDLGKSLFTTSNSDKLFIKNNYHFSPEGNIFVAKEIADYLKKNHYVLNK